MYGVCGAKTHLMRDLFRCHTKRRTGGQTQNLMNKLCFHARNPNMLGHQPPILGHYTSFGPNFRFFRSKARHKFWWHTPHMSVTEPVRMTGPVPPEADLVPLRCTFMRALLNISCGLYQIKGSGYLYVCVTGQARSFVRITVRRLYMVITCHPQSRIPGQHVQDW